MLDENTPDEGLKAEDQIDATENEQPVEEIEAEVEEVEAEQDEQEPDAENEDASDPDELVVTFGDEEPPEKEKSPVINELRKKAREEAKKRKELEKKLEELTATKPVDIGTKPTLKDCAYDDARFEAELIAWNDRKAKADAEKTKQQEAEKKAEDEWKERLADYHDRKVKLGARDFDEAEDVVKDVLSPNQQGMLLDACENPELVIYAIGKNPAKAEELAKITNPIRFAAAAARLEGKMKVTGMQKKPAPEKRLQGKTAPKASGSANTQLEKLREEAAKTGDHSKVVAFKRQMREKQGN